MSGRKIICILLCLAMLPAMTVLGLTAQQSSEELAQLLGTDRDHLLSSDELTAGDSNSDWAVFVAARNGATRGKDRYLEKLWDYVSDQYRAQGGLDPIKATQWHRITLTVLSLGADPTCFGTDAEGKPINLVADGTYNWKMTNSLGSQGINGWIYALLVLDAVNAEIPEDALYTRERIMEEILASQLPDGGFDIGSGASGIDITAMAIQALAPYYERDREIQQRIDGALSYLSNAQNAQGDFGSGGSESSAQVILALCALGIDPEEDARFCKPGGNALDGLLLYHQTDGGFSHTMNGKVNTLSTLQAAQALTALDRLRTGRGRLYDFSDLSIQPYAPGGTVLWWIPVVVLTSMVIVMILWIRKGKKSCTA